MDAVKFLKENNRMCKTFDLCDGRDCGAMCELYAKSNKKGLNCADYTNDYPEEAVAIVERWAKEHPKKTRQSEFLKMFPRVKIERDVIEFCPADMDSDFQCQAKEELSFSCATCKREFWLAEVDNDI